MGATRRAVFLDRDGVINPLVYHAEFGTVDSPANPDEFVLLPGVGSALSRIRSEGYLTILISNQPGIAKGKTSKRQLDAITEKMLLELAGEGGRLDGIYYCLHHPEAAVSEFRVQCDCRKPRPGLLLRAAQEHDIDLGESFMVGDGVGDIVAGQAAGLTTIFVSSRKCYVCDELDRQGARPHFVVDSLVSAADLIASSQRRNLSPMAPAKTGGCVMLESSTDYSATYLSEASEVLKRLDTPHIERIASLLSDLRSRGGRLFIVGVGGGAGHASHAVCDFRKIAQIEAYSVSDNVSELTARVNDEGWDTSYSNWLKGSRLNQKDMVFVFSVGGGDDVKNISANLVRALQHAKSVGAAVCGVVGRDGGYTAKVADACVVVPVVNSSTITPHTEAFQAVIWHLLVSHPALKLAETKWESVTVPIAAKAGS